MSIDFDHINNLARSALPQLLRAWLPEGKARGREYVSGDLRGAPGESLSINMQTGLWADFATGETGGDPVSLFAAIHGISQSDAARRIAQSFGIDVGPAPVPARAPGRVRATVGNSHNGSNGTIVPNGAAHNGSNGNGLHAGEAIFPVPRSAPPPIDHPSHGTPSYRWDYRDASGAILGVVARFDLGNGRKEVLPQIFTSRGWLWKSFPKPRWLYGLDELALRPDDPVMVVEGEPAADAARRLLPDYVVVTWPGGCKAVAHVDWSPLHGREVLIWPDRDRLKFTSGVSTGEEIPYEEQPGTVAACQIRDILLPECPDARVLDVSEFTSHGWDAKDCEKAGWTPAVAAAWLTSKMANAGRQSYRVKDRKLLPWGLRKNVDIQDFPKLADDFLKEYYSGANGPLRHYGGCWYLWSGTHYPEIETATIRHDGYEFLSNCVTNGKNSIDPVLPDRDMVSKLLDALAARVHLQGTAKAPCWVDGNPGPDPKECAVLQNGILHLSTRRLYPHTWRFWSHNCLPYNFEPAVGKPKEWMNFLASVWPDDPESIECLQEIMGYCLTSDTSLQKMFMIIGPRRSGKGTINRVMRALIGKDNFCSPTLDSLRDDFGLEQLIGKMLCVFSDVRLEGQTSSITEHLLSISGEDAKSINRKNMKHWNGQIIARFVMMTNLLPRFGDSSGALASRFIILTMKRSFLHREDVNLTGKLLSELPAIFNWALDGLDRLRARGRFVAPASSVEYTREFEELGAPISGFIRNVCVIDPNRTIGCVDLYQAWVRWCKDQGRDGHGTVQTFTRDLKAQEPNIATVTGRNSRHYFVGVGLAQETIAQATAAFDLDDLDYAPWGDRKW